MFRYSAVIFVVGCILTSASAQKCRADVVFMIDASDRTRSGNLFSDFTASLTTFVNTRNIGNDDIRVGAVFFNDIPTMTSRVPITANTNTLLASFQNQGPLGIALKMSIGLTEANTMFNTDLFLRPGVARLAILVTAGTSKGRIFPTVEAGTLKANNRNGRPMEVFAIGIRSAVGDAFNGTELALVASQPTNVFQSVQSFALNSVYNTIVDRYCVSPTLPPVSTPPPTAPTTLPPTLPPQPPTGLCGMLVGGVRFGSGPHPSACDKYVQCYMDNLGRIMMVFRPCPYGKYWNDNTKQCDFPSNVNCPYPVCTSTCKTETKMDWSCRSYWRCNGNKQEPDCCPMGFAFVPGYGCKPDFYCKDSCASKCGHTCDKKPDQNGDEMKYEMFMGPIGYAPMSCKPGKFDVVDCACSYWDKNKLDSKNCMEAISLNFSDPTLLQTNEDMGVKVQNVNVFNGVGNFKSDSYLHFKMHKPNNTKAMDYDCDKKVMKEPKHRLVIAFKYRPILPINGERVLVGSGDCGKGGRMYITHDQTAVYFTVESKYGAYTKVAIPTQELPTNVFLEVLFIYDGKTIEGSVSYAGNKRVSRLVAPMSAKVLECGLGVGIGGLKNGFKGEIDDFKVTMCQDW